MVLNFNKKLANFSLLSLIILIGVNSSVINYKYNSNFSNLKTSSYWDLTGNPIYIDDLNPTYNWATINATYDWCRGNGTVGNPYIIENVYLDAQNLGSGIEIRNSNVYFIIKNCTLLRASLGTFPEFNAGISLENTNNGLIIGNNCSLNKCAGINLYNSHDNEIIDNKVYFNEWEGIRIFQSNNNNLTQNTIEDNYYSSPGIYLLESLNTHIEANKIKNNNRGIEFYRSNFTTVIGNDIENLLYHYAGSNTNINGNNLTEGIFFNFHSKYNDYNTISGNTLGPDGLRVWMSGVDQDNIATHNIIDSSNTVNEKPLYFFQNQNGLGATDFINHGQLILINCNHSKLKNLNISDSHLPISIYFSDNCSVIANNFTNCEYGIYCDQVTNSFFINNFLFQTVEYGISLTGGFNCSIENNTCISSSLQATGSNHSIKHNIGGLAVGGNNHTILDNSASSLGLSGNNNFMAFNNASYLSINGDYNKIVHNLIENSGVTLNGDYIEFSNNNVSNAGIDASVSNSLISGNQIKNSNVMGIYFNGRNSTIRENIIVDNVNTGIYVGSSEDCIIDNNYFDNNGNYDIYLIQSYNITLLNNQMYDNGIGIDDEQYENYLMIKTSLKIDTSNTVNDAPIFYYSNQTNLDEFDFVGAGQIILINCNSSTISNVDISSVTDPLILYHCNLNTITDVSLTNNNLKGLYLYDSHDCIISDSTFSNNGVSGLYLRDSHSNVISENTFNSNGIFGIYLRDSSYNNFTENYINNNNIGAGIRDLSIANTFYLNFIQSNTNYGAMINSSAIENLIYNNTFSNTGINAYDDGINTYWDNGSIGNFWHDYTGSDLNDNGIGDTPYYIVGAGGGSDNFPLWLDGDEPPETNGDGPPEIPIDIIIYSIFFGSLVGVAALVVVLVRKRRIK